MAENLLADLMGSLLIVAPAAFGIVFAYWLYKKLCKISLFRQSREDDEALLRRVRLLLEKRGVGARDCFNEKQHLARPMTSP